jgi:predicted aldo/keto reductase-like oxidoreductase
MSYIPLGKTGLMASRMSPQAAVEISKIPMESVSLCTECRECVDHCPHKLPIPDMLKVHYDLYEQHKAQIN